RSGRLLLPRSLMARRTTQRGTPQMLGDQLVPDHRTPRRHRALQPNRNPAMDRRQTIRTTRLATPNRTPRPTDPQDSPLVVDAKRPPPRSRAWAVGTRYPGLRSQPGRIHRNRRSPVRAAAVAVVLTHVWTGNEITTSSSTPGR